MAKQQPMKVTALDKLNFEVLQRMGGHAGILRGWKEIAGFLRVSKRTAMLAAALLTSLLLGWVFVFAALCQEWFYR